MTGEQMRAAEIAETKMADAWAAVLGSEQGRAVIWSILQATFLFEQTHGGDALDGFRAGQREVGLQIVRNRVMPAGFDMLGRLQAEAAKRAQEALLAAKKTTPTGEKDFLDE